LKTCLYSQNDDYGFSEGLIDTSKASSFSEVYTQVAYWSLYADVQEKLSELVDGGPEAEEIEAPEGWPTEVCSEGRCTNDPEYLDKEDPEERYCPRHAWGKKVLKIKS
jgi:hypothetical protein